MFRTRAWKFLPWLIKTVARSNISVVKIPIHHKHFDCVNEPQKLTRFFFSWPGATLSPSSISSGPPSSSVSSKASNYAFGIFTSYKIIPTSFNSVSKHKWCFISLFPVGDVCIIHIFINHIHLLAHLNVCQRVLSNIFPLIYVLHTLFLYIGAPA